jgi:hypothetical protein
MSSKRSARVMCKERCFWITPKQFWAWVHDDIIDFVGERPLTGKYRGHNRDFLVRLENTILDAACPEHLRAVLQIKHRLKSLK